MTALTTEYNPTLFHVINSEKIYLSSETEENLKKFKSEINQKHQLFLFTGDQGVGKKTLVQRFAFDPKGSKYLININKDILDQETLIDFMLKDLEVDYQEDNETNQKLSFLEKILNTEKIKHIIFHVDQSLVYQQQKLDIIFEFVDSKPFDKCILHLVITALTGFSKQLNASDILSNAIKNAIFYNIQPLSENEIRAYIKFHLELHDAQEDIVFSDEALERIIFYSRGLPNLISRLCSGGSLMASIEEESTITVKMLNEVLENSVLHGNEFNYSTELSPLKQSATLSVNDNDVEEDPIDLSSEKKTEEIEDSITPYLMDNVVDELDSPTQDLQLIGNDKKEAEENNKIEVLLDEEGAFGFSKKSVFLPAFVVGILFAGAIGIGWYFSQEKGDQNPISNTDVLVKKNIALETRLKKLEERLEKQKLISSHQIRAKNNEQKSNDSQKERSELEETIKEVKEVRKKITEVRQQVKNAVREGSLDNSGSNTESLLRNTRHSSISLDEKIKEGLLIRQRRANNILLDTDLNKLLYDKKGVKKLLMIAEKKITQKILTKPLKNSALAIYQTILQYFPDNKEALAGIKRISTLYIHWANYEIGKGNYSHARYLYGKALEVTPDNQNIISALKRLKSY